MHTLVVDSALNREQAILHNLPEGCPESITENLHVLDVIYIGFDKKLHQGQIVVHKQLGNDLAQVFELALEIQFPFERVIPLSQPDFLWSDERSMAANNTSAFNYRMKAGKSELSVHARGCAIDINPLLNPYIRGNTIQPSGATYDPSKTGALTAEHPIVQKFKGLGWSWGGDWKELKDYQHFEKKVD